MITQAVTNSACLIALERIRQLDLLSKAFTDVFAPIAVQAELGITVSWLNVREVKNAALVAALVTQIDNGEAEAIALATEISDAFVILDDKKARNIAGRMGLKVIGTIGMLLRSKNQGVVSEIKPLLDALQSVGFHMTNALYSEALKLADENS